LDALDSWANTHEFYSSFDYERYHHHYCHYPYRRSEKKYLPNKFKKSKPPIFDGEVKKLEDAKTWLLGRNSLNCVIIQRI